MGNGVYTDIYTSMRLRLIFKKSTKEVRVYNPTSKKKPPNKGLNRLSSSLPLINILTRTGNREILFNRLQKSIKEQDYTRIRHLKSNDNPTCVYLNNINDVIYVHKYHHLGKGWYNLYLNTLAQHVLEGWVIILDDDAKLILSSFISSIAKVCSNLSSNDILIYQIKNNKDGRLLPTSKHMNNSTLEFRNIDMACFVCHYSIFDRYKFTAEQGGDFKFINKLSKDKNLKLKFISLPIGIWSNYQGPKFGKN